MDLREDSEEGEDGDNNNNNNQQDEDSDDDDKILELMRACVIMCTSRSSDISEVKNILDSGVDINSIGNGRTTALMIACMSDNKYLAEFLLARKCDTNLRNKDNLDALGLACQYSREEIVKVLIRYGADVNGIYGISSDKMSITPMTFAMSTENTKIMDILLKTGCNYEFTKGFTDLLYKHKRINLLKPLAANNINDCKKHLFMLVIFKACKLGDIECVREQLESNPDLIDTIDPESNDTLAHIACRINNLEILLILIEFGIDLNIVNINNETIATIACIYGSSDILNVLAKKNCIDGKGMLFINDSIAMLMKDHPLCENFKILLEANRHLVNTIDPKTKDSLLHCCCRYNKLDALLLLLTYDVDINLLNSNNETASQVAYSVSSLKSLKILVSMDANGSKFLYKLASSIIYQVLRGDFMTQDYNSWKVPSFNLKYFVSSTFTDTHQERNVIMTKLLPELQAIARPHGIAITFVDMRWGVKDENTDDHKTWDACKIELERCKSESCKTFFISLQGYKYGYRPLPRSIDKQTFDSHVNNYIGSDRDELIEIAKNWYILDGNAVPPTYYLTALDSNNRDGYWDDNKNNVPRVLGKLLKLLNGLMFEDGLCVGDSVTNWEAIAAFQGSDERILWMNRIIVDQITLTVDPWREYNDVEGIPDLGRRYLKLIDMMQAKLDVIHRIEKTTIDSLMSLKSKNDKYDIYISEFYSKLSTVLVSELKGVIQMKESWLNNAYDSGLGGDTCEDILHHYAWARLKVENFSGREELIESALRRLTERTTGGLSLCLLGRSGCGKTSFMAKLASLLYNPGGVPVVIRFCGTNSNSSDGISLMKSIIKQIHYINRLNELTAEEYTDVVKYFHDLLARYPILLLIDSIDQLSNDHLARSKLSFLEGVKPHPKSLIVVSCLPDETITEGYWYGCDTTLMSWEVPRIEMTLDDKDTETILDSYISRNRRALTDSQRQLCLESIKRESTALYATLVARVACSWKSTESSCILASTTALLINQIFDEIQRNYGKILVKAVVAFISLSVDGITSTEMEDLLSLEDDVMIEVNKYNQSSRLPSHVWLRVKSEISGLIVESGQGCIRWYHRQFIETANARYNENEKVHYYQSMGKYFSDIIDDASISKKGISKQSLLLKDDSVLKPIRFRSSQPYINKRRCTEGCSNLLKGELIVAAIDEICQPDLVYGNIICGNGFKLINYMVDIRNNSSIKVNSPAKYKRVEEYMRWLQKNMTVIVNNIDFLCKTAFDLPEVSCARQDVEEMIKSSKAASIDDIAYGDDVWVKMKTLHIKPVDECLINLVGHESSIKCLCYSSDGLRIATADSKSVKVWSAVSGEVINTLQNESRGPTRDIYSIHFNTDGSRLLALAQEENDYPIRVWSVKSGVVMLDIESARFMEQGYSFSVITSRFAFTSCRAIKVFNIDTCEKCLEMRVDSSRPKVEKLCYSKDGTRLFAATDEEIEIWNSINGDFIRTTSDSTSCLASGPTELFYISSERLCSLHVEYMYVCSNTFFIENHKNGMRNFCISSDGTLIASEGYRGQSVNADIKLWNGAGKCIQTFFEYTNNGCSMMEFTQDGSLLIIVFDENWRIWNTKTFERLHIGAVLRIGQVCTSSDGSRIAVVETYSSEVKVFESSSLKSNCVRCTECHNVRITCASCNSNATMIATGSLNGTIKLWNSSWDNMQTLQAHILKVVSVNFDSSDDRLCSASIDKTIRIWNCSTGECDFSFVAESEFNSLYNVNILSAYFSDASTITVVYNDGFIKVWDKTGACQCKYDHSNIYDHKFSEEVVERIRSSCYNKEKCLLACSDSRYTNIWNTTTGECTKTLDSCKAGWFNYGRQPICFNAEGSKIITGCLNNIICFDVDTGEDINWACVLDPAKSNDDDYSMYNKDLPEEYRVRSVCFSSDESTILVGVYNIVTIIDSTTFGAIYTLQGQTTVESVFSLSQNLVITAFRDGVVKLWDTSNIRDVSGDYRRQTIDAKTAVSVHGNCANDCVVTLFESNESYIWDIAKGQKISMIQEGNMMCVCFSHDGSKIASGFRDNHLIKVWSSPDVKCILTLSGHSFSVCTIGYSSDDKVLVSGCWHVPEIKLWNAITGECLHTIEEDKLPRSYRNAASPISFTPDGSKLIWISCSLSSRDDDDEVSSIKIWNTVTYEYTNIIKNVDKAASICCSNDIIVAGSREESRSLKYSFFKIFSISSGQCTYTYEASPTPSASFYTQIYLAISRSGNRIISALNKTVTIWSIDGECLCTLRPFNHELSSLSCSYDASKIVCIGDGDIVTYEFFK